MDERAAIGLWWSTAAGSATHGHRLYTYPTAVRPQNLYYRGNGIAVRCVVREGWEWRETALAQRRGVGSKSFKLAWDFCSRSYRLQTPPEFFSLVFCIQRISPNQGSEIFFGASGESRTLISSLENLHTNRCTTLANLCWGGISELNRRPSGPQSDALTIWANPTRYNPIIPHLSKNMQKSS